MYRLKMRWHEKWCMHYYRIYSAIYDKEVHKDEVEKIMNRHWYLWIAYEEYLKAKKERKKICIKKWISSLDPKRVKDTKQK